MDRNTATGAAKEVYDKMSVTATETADLVKTSYSTALKGAQDYNNKLLEFAKENVSAAFDFTHRAAGAKSPSEFVSLSTEHMQKQVERLADQAKQLAALAQNVMVATSEPLKRSSFNQLH